MRKRSDQVRAFIVSCRLSEDEMDMLQKMSCITDCSVSDLLRQGLGFLTRNDQTAIEPDVTSFQK